MPIDTQKNPSVYLQRAVNASKEAKEKKSASKYLDAAYYSILANEAADASAHILSAIEMNRAFVKKTLLRKSPRSVTQTASFFVLLAAHLENSRTQDDSSTHFLISAAYYSALEQEDLTYAQKLVHTCRSTVIRKLESAKYLENNPMYYAILAHTLATVDSSGESLENKQGWWLCAIYYYAYAGNDDLSLHCMTKLHQLKGGIDLMRSESLDKQFEAYNPSFYMLLQEYLNQHDALATVPTIASVGKVYDPRTFAPMPIDPPDSLGKALSP